jgi:hypothetical protein
MRASLTRGVMVATVFDVVLIALMYAIGATAGWW